MVEAESEKAERQRAKSRRAEMVEEESEKAERQRAKSRRAEMVEEVVVAESGGGEQKGGAAESGGGERKGGKRKGREWRWRWGQSSSGRVRRSTRGRTGS